MQQIVACARGTRTRATQHTGARAGAGTKVGRRTLAHTRHTQPPSHRGREHTAARQHSGAGTQGTQAQATTRLAQVIDGHHPAPAARGSRSPRHAHPTYTPAPAPASPRSPHRRARSAKTGVRATWSAGTRALHRLMRLADLACVGRARFCQLCLTSLGRLQGISGRVRLSSPQMSSGKELYAPFLLHGGRGPALAVGHQQRQHAPATGHGEQRNGCAWRGRAGEQRAAHGRRAWDAQRVRAPRGGHGRRRAMPRRANGEVEVTSVSWQGRGPRQASGGSDGAARKALQQRATHALAATVRG